MQNRHRFFRELELRLTAAANSIRAVANDGYKKSREVLPVTPPFVGYNSRGRSEEVFSEILHCICIYIYVNKHYYFRRHRPRTVGKDDGISRRIEE